MDVTVNIKAPAIVEAINRLSEVLNLALTSGVTANQAISLAESPIEVVQQSVSEVLDTTPTNAQTLQNVGTAPSQNSISATANAPQTAVQIPQNAPMAMTSNQPPVQQTAPIVDDAYRTRVCNAAARLVEQNKMPGVLALLSSFGVQAVTQLTATQLPEFANGLVAMGAVI